MNILIITLLACSDVVAQDSLQVTRSYDNSKPSSVVDSVYYAMPNQIFISLDEGFNDSLYITVNDITMLNKYLVTNESIGFADEFGFAFKDSSATKILRLKFVKANFYIEEKVNLHYKSLRIIGRENHWELYYSNHFPIRE